MKIRHRTARHLAIMALVLPMFAGVAAAQSAGTVIATEGTVVVTNKGGASRIVSPGSTVTEGDAIRTERESTARVRFADDSELTVRPETSLRVASYHYESATPKKDNFALELFRGAIRQITGFIGKRGNQDAYRLQSGPATIGIRGTDFTARVCEANECEGKPQSATPVITPIVGRIAEKNGTLTAVASNGQRRDLSVGSPVFENDYLETAKAGHAALVLTDKTRLVLPPDSALRVTAYGYAEKEPEKSNLFFNLIRGGLRVVTGLIGKSVPARVNFGTSTATIGIRGTSFDLACVPANIPNPEGYGGGTGSCAGGGLFTATREGAISVTTEDGNTTVFQAGENGYLPEANKPPLLIRFSPEFLKNLPGPLPEKLEIDFEALFGLDADNFGSAGLYVTVSDGKILLIQADRELLLGVGETGYAPTGGTPPVRLDAPPAFLGQDQVETSTGFGYQGCKM